MIDPNEQQHHEANATEASAAAQTPLPGADALHASLVEAAQLPLTKDQIKLAARRESGEIDQHDYDLNEIFMLNDNGLPLRRSDVGKQAVVLSRADFVQLGNITFIHASGEEMTVEADSLNDPVFILFPEDLGD